MNKKNEIDVYKNAATLRTKNRRVTVVHLDDGRYIIEFDRYVKDPKPNEVGATSKFIKKNLLKTVIGLSFDGMEHLMQVYLQLREREIRDAND